MKKFYLLLAGIICMGVLSANAQGLIIKAGFNYNNVDLSKNTTVSDIKSGKTGWQAGVAYQSEASHGFSFQPELIYKVSGVKLTDATDLRLGYVDVPLNVQWGPDLLIARPFIFAGPYLGFKLSNTFKGTVNDIPETQRQDVIDGLTKVEWGLGIGLGINIFKFQVAGKYNWNFGKVSDVQINNLPTLQGTPRTFELSVGLRF